MFIVLEGGDGCGKSTQVGMLKACLDSRGIPCVALKYPDRSSTTGPFISSYLRGDCPAISIPASNRVLAANVWEVADAVQGSLAQGKVVIADRYMHSYFAYAMARGSTWEQVTSMLDGVHPPDLVVFLDIDPEEALDRKTEPLEMLETVDFQRKVQMHYKRSVIQPDWVVLDARLTRQCMHEKLVQILEAKLKLKLN